MPTTIEYILERYRVLLQEHRDLKAESEKSWIESCNQPTQHGNILPQVEEDD